MELDELPELARGVLVVRCTSLARNGCRKMAGGQKCRAIPQQPVRVRVRHRSVVCIDATRAGPLIARALRRGRGSGVFDEPGGMMDQVMCAMGAHERSIFILRSRRIP